MSGVCLATRGYICGGDGQKVACVEPPQIIGTIQAAPLIGSAQREEDPGPTMGGGGPNRPSISGAASTPQGGPAGAPQIISGTSSKPDVGSE